jgi:SAM-dependent methyltransferase
MSECYDDIADLYHLIFQDWDASIERQAAQLTDIIRGRWGASVRSILDVSCGIGTQAIGLASRGFAVTASDLSPQAVARARLEAQRRGVTIDVSVCDMRACHDHHARQFDLVISADNSITHLLDDDELLTALRQMYECTRPGGGCLLTVRDYDREERGVGLVKPFGIREEGAKRYLIFQVWDFAGPIYDLAMYFVEDDRSSAALTTRVLRTRYNAIGTNRLLDLMRAAGFIAAERLDGHFYQPVLVASRPASAQNVVIV